MVLETLDRAQWCFAEALAHVERVVVAHRSEAAVAEPMPARPPAPWEPKRDPLAEWKKQAYQQLIVALRDGDLHARGRYSEERPTPWGSGSGVAFHSGHHSSILPEQWRMGRQSNDALTSIQWEFVDILVPRFMVLAIWPEHVPSRSPEPPTARDYSTPYLDLMHEAIARFGLTEVRQEKKETLVEWFLAAEVEGEPISRNLADAMATLIRMPSSQRGGCTSTQEPKLSRAS